MAASWPRRRWRWRIFKTGVGWSFEVSQSRRDSCGAIFDEWRGRRDGAVCGCWTALRAEARREVERKSVGASRRHSKSPSCGARRTVVTGQSARSGFGNGGGRPACGRSGRESGGARECSRNIDVQQACGWLPGRRHHPSPVTLYKDAAAWWHLSALVWWHLSAPPATPDFHAASERGIILNLFHLRTPA